MIDDSDSIANPTVDRPERGKKRYDEGRLLDPWERYRVLTDIAKLQLDLLEMADRRTRFALLILGTLNALNIVLVARPDLLGPSGIRLEPIPGIAVYTVVYAGISIYLFVQAVVALKPRAAPLIGKPEGRDRRLRHIGAIVSQTADEYLEGWKQASIADVNRELAFHVQLSARVTAEKYTAIGWLYWGLMLLVAMTATMLSFVVLRLLLGSPTT